MLFTDEVVELTVVPSTSIDDTTDEEAVFDFGAVKSGLPTACRRSSRARTPTRRFEDSESERESGSDDPQVVLTENGATPASGISSAVKTPKNNAKRLMSLESRSSGFKDVSSKKTAKGVRKRDLQSEASARALASDAKKKRRSLSVKQSFDRAQSRGPRPTSAQSRSEQREVGNLFYKQYYDDLFIQI